MTPMRQVFPVAAALVAVVGAGVVHGYWTERWSVSEAAAAVPARLAQVPAALGEWDGEPVADATPPPDVSGHLYRRYRHRRTGEVVTVALIGGRPGPVSIHTPDVCYGGNGYDVAQPVKHAAPAEAGAGAVFLTAQFVKTRAAEQTRLRIFWAWSANGTWGVPDNPRVAFARSPVLYKLYLIRELPAGKQPVQDDPCNELMRVLLPELQRLLFAGA
jgi:Protein of unknown function (DUF3485)